MAVKLKGNFDTSLNQARDAIANLSDKVWTMDIRDHQFHSRAWSSDQLTEMQTIQIALRALGECMTYLAIQVRDD